MRFVFTVTVCGMAVWMAFGTSAMAQQKFGYINSSKILEKMPEYDGIQRKLNRMVSRWRTELKRMKKHIDSLQVQFKAKKLLYSDERKTREKKKIKRLIEQRKQYLHNKFGPNGRYFQKQQQLLKPVQRKLYQAVSKVAKQENIDFVFDRANNTALLFAQKRWNLNKKVLQALHITLQK